MILKLDNVSKNYSKVKALDNVSTSFLTGHIYGLLGRNGAGKSTMIKAITGKINLNEGSILLNGKNPIIDEDSKKNIFSVGEENFFCFRLKG